MTLRSFALVAFSVLSFAAGCSAETTESSGASSADVVAAPSNDLLDRTILKGTVTVGETSKVAYQPDQYREAQIDGVPYLAWELIDAPATGGIQTKANRNAGSHLAIQVEGNFPGLPDVLLVDESFNLLAQTRGTSTDLGDTASLEVDAAPGKKFILVRDMDWVRPMDFEISVAR